MRQFNAFIKKEVLELIRSGKLFLLLILFTAFGIMNPAIAKLTPWLMETMADSLAEAGMTITEVEINALTSWTQFYKNVPMALILFVLMFSGILTNEYQKGTLINMLTKGMMRWKVVVSKLIVMIVTWSIGYWLCFGITYVYNAYFWDNSIASHLYFSAFCMYLVGIWLSCLILLLSALFSSTQAVLAGSACIFIGVYVLEFFPKVQPYLPTFLMSSQNITFGKAMPEDYLKAIVVTVVVSIVFGIGTVLKFNKKGM